MGFYQNFIKKCEEKNVSPSRAAQDVGLSNAAASGWKNGKEPNDLTLQKLATYFECDVADLTGKTSFVKRQWRSDGVEIGGLEDKPVYINYKSDFDEYEELLEELQTLRDREDLRALLDVSKKNTPEQIRRLIAMLEAMNNESSS